MEATSEVLGLVLSSPVHERYEPTGVSPVQCHKDDYRSGASFGKGKAERVGTVQPREEKAQGAGATQQYKHLSDGRQQRSGSKTLSSGH